MEQVLHIPKRKWETYVQHHSQANDLGASFEITEVIRFRHSIRLFSHPTRSKRVSSDNVVRAVTFQILNPVVLRAPIRPLLAREDRLLRPDASDARRAKGGKKPYEASEHYPVFEVSYQYL